MMARESASKAWRYHMEGESATPWWLAAPPQTFMCPVPLHHRAELTNSCDTARLWHDHVTAHAHSVLSSHSIHAALQARG